MKASLFRESQTQLKIKLDSSVALQTLGTMHPAYNQIDR